MKKIFVISICLGLLIAMAFVISGNNGIDSDEIEEPPIPPIPPCRSCAGIVNFEIDSKDIQEPPIPPIPPILEIKSLRF
jgi:hypothetical protein